MNVTPVQIKRSRRSSASSKWRWPIWNRSGGLIINGNFYFSFSLSTCIFFARLVSSQCFPICSTWACKLLTTSGGTWSPKIWKRLMLSSPLIFSYAATSMPSCTWENAKKGVGYSSGVLLPYRYYPTGTKVSMVYLLNLSILGNEEGVLSLSNCFVGEDGTILLGEGRCEANGKEDTKETDGHFHFGGFWKKIENKVQVLSQVTSCFNFYSANLQEFWVTFFSPCREPLSQKLMAGVLFSNIFVVKYYSIISLLKSI